MHVGRRIAYRWVPLAGVATALCALLALAVQQMWRHLANDPQIQMARDAAMALNSGQPVASVVPAIQIDMARSLAPFVIVSNNAGVILASSGRLDGQFRGVPAGVLDHVRDHDEERVAWQPERGVRLAAVIVRTSGALDGFVLVGRSLRETEDRTRQFQRLMVLAWIGVLGGLLVLVAASEYALGSA